MLKVGGRADNFFTMSLIVLVHLQRMPFKAHELRDRAESLRRMAREATVEPEREALGRRAAENLVSMVMERRRSSLDRNSPH